MPTLTKIWPALGVGGGQVDDVSAKRIPCPRCLELALAALALRVRAAVAPRLVVPDLLIDALLEQLLGGGRHLVVQCERQDANLLREEGGAAGPAHDVALATDLHHGALDGHGRQHVMHLHLPLDDRLGARLSLRQNVGTLATR